MLEFHIQNLYIRVDKRKATKEELSNLHEILSVKVPGHYFSPHFRRGMWDGYKRFFNRLTSTFYTGLLGYAISRLQFPYVIIDDRVPIPHQNNPLVLNGIELRDYQIKMVSAAISKGRGIISAPPNAGKTEVAAGIIKVLGLPAIFLTHRLTLLRQTKERFSNRLGVEIGLVGGGIDSWISDGINIVSIQSAYRKLDEFKDRVKGFPIVISDECFPSSAKVLLDSEKFVSIKEVYQNSKIEYILSYNHEKNVLEKCRVLRKIRNRTLRPAVLSLYIDLSGKLFRVCCTPNHKLFVNGYSYIRADEVKVGDCVKVLDITPRKVLVCRECGRIMKNGSSYGGHSSTHRPTRLKCKICGRIFYSHKELFEHQRLNHTVSIRCRKCNVNFSSRSDYTKHHMIVHYGKTSEFKKNILRAGRIRGDAIKGDGNPSRDPLVKKKQSIRQKAWWANMNKEERDWRLKTFMNAPIWAAIKPTSLERKIINFEILGLEYTGMGTFWVRLPNGKNKNPDFVYRKGRKIIEVADIEFWHKVEDLNELVRLYKKIGYDCLVLSAVDFKDSDLKGRIEKFLFNHEGRVVRIRKHVTRSKFLYNLEVENNHNYFVNNVLVSNCHHVSSKSFEKLLKLCSESHYKYGLSATPLLRDDVSNMTVRGLLGDEIVAVTNQELIAAGISAFPSVYLLNVREPKIPDHFTFDQAYEKGILFNDYRNKLVVRSAEKFLGQDKSVFILVWRIAHGEVLKDLFIRRGIEVEFISGQEKSETIKSVLERFGKKELKCVISSTISDEGLDVPAVDVLILAVGFKAPLKTIQRVGRGLRRKTEGENVVSVVDFVDWQSRRYLYKHSIDRVREYVKMGIKIYEVSEDWKRIEER